MSKSKNWCFTLNNPETTTVDLELKLRAVTTYYVFQEESGENDTRHYQGYIQTEIRCMLPAVKKLIPRAHWEVARGNPVQNKKYCTKEPRISGPYEWGTPIKQGQRVDIEQFRDAILNGKKDTDLIKDYPIECAQYQRFIQFVRNANFLPRTTKPRVIVYYGPSGSGKTRRAYNHSGPERTYMVSKPDNGRPLWWDSYNPTEHETIILDDFYGWLPWSFLLQLLDRYPFQVEVKGGKIQFNSPNIFLTSNTEPKTWYKNVPNEDMTPLLRRIDEIHLME